ncbi:MAG TPA: universal stress protein [Candidatus Binatia bacterium]|nr:universal stress protein [Candidatus Binatia bacterium]
MYSKILVPLDGSSLSEQILPYARWIASAYKIPVELLRIRDPDVRPPFWPPETSDQYLKKVAAKFFPSGAARIAEVGAPAEVITDRANSDPSCLIAMATHGMSGVRRWLLGSVASKVVQTVANPLLIIRPSQDTDELQEPKLDRVLVPLDGSGLAEKILPHVRALAKTDNIEIHLLRVYTLPPDAYVVADGVIAQGPAPYREELKKEAQTYLDGLMAGLLAEGPNRVIATALEGDPAGEIIDLARKTPNDLIAISTYGRSGIGRWVLGSVAEKVVQHSRGPVLLVRAS